MSKEEIRRLPLEEQSFIYEHSLQGENYEYIKEMMNHHDIAEYLGWI